ncbi:MAG: hypothetical protein JNJ71_11775 [Rubrivivax sp.]|nr:hypothetical protein [Rubrivivax sp.]
MATRKSASEFQSPKADEDTPHGSESSEFEAPGASGSLDAESVEAETSQFLQRLDPQVLAAKAEIEKLLAELAGDSEGAQSAAAQEANIVGVGISLGDPAHGFAGVPGEPVLEIYTLEPEAASETRARLAAVAGVSAMASADFPMNVVHTGMIDAQAHRMRLRPAPGGISVGHTAVTAGTFGCLVRGRSAPRNARLMVLSNNHVLANVNAGPIGHSVVQPGSFDGGRHPADQIAILERFVPVNFAAGAANVVDCATAWAWPDRVRKELMYLSNGAVQTFTIGAQPVAPAVGMLVGKTGRTTQLKQGRITAVGVTVNVNFGGGRVARFVNQISIRGTGPEFSAGGDSGSLIWTWDARRAPVGLLFAGGGGTTFANPIASVLAALDVSIVA